MVDELKALKIFYETIKDSTAWFINEDNCKEFAFYVDGAAEITERMIEAVKDKKI